MLLYQHQSLAVMYVVTDCRELKDWSMCWMVNGYKSKDDALTCGLYQGHNAVRVCKKEKLFDGSC